MAGGGEVAVGLILMVIFFATLTIDAIPIIWTGALFGGIVMIIRGIYHGLKGEGRQEDT